MVVALPYGMVQRRMLGDRLHPVIIKLVARSINVDVALGGDVLISLEQAALGGPAETLCVSRVKRAAQRDIVRSCSTSV